ncbi:nitrogenase-stabilizing/protective protein NifW [Anaeromyxobacter oryzae]|uniref:Nitrogenase-stabilizing/protective protein NifW n=1 Tax=Anaeromyxobacter oryzae TaxID=2918170 RepID=A0ABM7X211_9BACT|nr:nitrogenase-stabilizing/protective protein NifW [Anaeromyxobacter oryzae]BDG05810.1 hypothetical protein AMOR_48060 [Anaeromyxobacter oryzae]
MRLDDLHGLTEAEDYFAALDVPFDAAALAPIRLAVLRRFGLELEAITGWIGASDEARVAAARDALAAAYRALRERGAREPRLRRDVGPLVQLGSPRAR